MSMKKRVAAVAISGALLGGGLAIPWALTAQPAVAAPQGPWMATSTMCGLVTAPQAGTGTIYLNTKNGRLLCFLG